ncbi:MAG: class I SAM-dependent methyltransferase [Chloroflexi bacterium]|nr:class I SAM-dependent methyltransferase [Chloroflexota bacterium]
MALPMLPGPSGDSTKDEWLFSDRRMKEEIYQLTYELEQSYWWYVARRQIVTAQLAALLRSKVGMARILDYGCGTGLNLTHFAGLGDAYGVDVSPTAIAFCRERGLTQVAMIGAQEELCANPFGQLFDVVTMLDVLEHIPDDACRLQQIGKWLKPGGLLMVTVPAFEFLWSGEDYVSQHVRRYSGRSLARLFRHTGYEIVKLSYFNTLLFPAQVATILWKRLCAPRSMYQSNLAPLRPDLNWLLTCIMSFESLPLRRYSLPIGGSILCCGRLAS